MNYTKRVITGFALLAAATLTLGTAFAQEFPSKPIKVIVPFAAGGLTDAFARSMAQVAQGKLPGDQPIFIVNKPGGGATIGATAAVTVDPDGYTLLFTTSSPIVIQPHYGKTADKAEDFRGIIRAYDIPIGLTVRKDSELQTFDQWLDWVQKNPGKFTYGTSGVTGSGGHILAEQLAEALNVEIRQIPFEGYAPLTAAVMGGQVMGGIQLPDVHNGGELHGLIFLSPSKPVDEAYKSVPT